MMEIMNMMAYFNVKTDQCNVMTNKNNDHAVKQSGGKTN